MKTWVCLELRETGPLGLPSLAGLDLAGRAVIERTAARARRTADIEGLAVLVEPGAAETARNWLGPEAEGVRVLEVLKPDSPRREALRRALKWAKDGWRLGIRQAIDLDNAGHFASLSAAAKELNAGAILSVLPESVLIDPAILGGLKEHGAPEGQPPLPTAMCQAPAGFAGLFAMAGWLEPMSAQDRAYSDLYAWRPGRGSQDHVHRPENWLAPVAVRRAGFRASIDSVRSREIVETILKRAPGADGLGPAAAETAGMVQADPALFAGRLPRVVSIELTTEGRVPFKDTPAAKEIPKREMTRELFEKILDDLAVYDDVLLTLSGGGGWGDPLAHPEVFDFLKLAREKGIYGLHVETAGPLLDEAAAGRLAEMDIDIVSVHLGANTSATYHELTGRDDFEQICANVEKLAELRKATGRAWPFVCVEAAKRIEVEAELSEFFEGWSKKVDWVTILPFSDYAGQLPDRATVNLTLAERTCCCRLLKEMIVLADGTVPVCRMDYKASEPAGSAKEKSVEELWTSGRIAALRVEQHGRKFDGFKLCPKCRDWDNV